MPKTFREGKKSHAIKPARHRRTRLKKKKDQTGVKMNSRYVKKILKREDPKPSKIDF